MGPAPLIFLCSRFFQTFGTHFVGLPNVDIHSVQRTAQGPHVLSVRSMFPTFMPRETWFDCFFCGSQMSYPETRAT